MKRTDCEPEAVKPLPKKVISVLPLEGTRDGLKNRGERGQNRITALSFAKIFVNFLLSVISLILAGPRSKYF